jgi:hypothetical protein
MSILSSHLHLCFQSRLFLICFPIQLLHAFVTSTCVILNTSTSFASLNGGAVWWHEVLNTNISVMFNNAISVFSCVRHGLLFEEKGIYWRWRWLATFRDVAPSLLLDGYWSSKGICCLHYIHNLEGGSSGFPEMLIKYKKIHGVMPENTVSLYSHRLKNIVPNSELGVWT